MDLLIDRFRSEYGFDSWDEHLTVSDTAQRPPFALYLAPHDPFRRIARSISAASGSGEYYTLFDTVEYGGRLFRIRTTPYVTLQAAKEGFLHSLVASVSYVRDATDLELGLCFAHNSGSIAFLRDYTTIHIGPLGVPSDSLSNIQTADHVRELALFVARQLSVIETRI